MDNVNNAKLADLANKQKESIIKDGRVFRNLDPHVQHIVEDNGQGWLEVYNALDKVFEQLQLIVDDPRVIRDLMFNGVYGMERHIQFKKGLIERNANSLQWLVASRNKQGNLNPDEGTDLDDQIENKTQFIETLLHQLCMADVLRDSLEKLHDSLSVDLNLDTMSVIKGKMEAKKSGKPVVPQMELTGVDLEAQNAINKVKSFFKKVA